jgi:hypothetical protein
LLRLANFSVNDLRVVSLNKMAFYRSARGLNTAF